MSGAAVSRDGGSAPRAGRPCHSRVLQAGGKDFLAAVVSLPGGRWALELGGEGVPDALLSAAGLRSLPGQSISQESVRLVGFAVLQGWRWMSGPAPSADAYALVQILKRHSRRRRLGNDVFLQHQNPFQLLLAGRCGHPAEVSAAASGARHAGAPVFT